MKRIYVIIFLVLAALTSNVNAENAGKGFVSGRAVLTSGKAIQHAVVLFYVKQNGPPPLPERYWRVPDAAVPADPDGKFSAELQEGDYYVGAIGRVSSLLTPGPPLEGDVLVLLKDKSGNPKVITVIDGKTINIGTQKGFPYRKSVRKNKITTIEGLVTMLDGTPVPGAFVFAFLSPERGSHPVFASEKTDKLGKYVLRVDGDGIFYLKARDTYGGGKPQNGQLIGTFGGDEPASVTVKIGSSQKRIDIKVNQIQRPEGN
jgi:hypothetical protein